MEDFFSEKCKLIFIKGERRIWDRRQIGGRESEGRRREEWRDT
jgi:hypothetical protein